MTLEEAAAVPEEQPEAAAKKDEKGFWRRSTERSWQGQGFDPPPGFEERWGKAARAYDARWRQTEDDKRQWRAAFEAARRRGLDEEAERQQTAKPRRQSQQRKSDRRMNPFLHARTLLRDTTLPITEIAQITRLDIYEVVGLKLKMRSEARMRA